MLHQQTSMFTCAGRRCWPYLAPGTFLAGPLVSFPLCWESSCCSNAHGVMNPGPPPPNPENGQNPTQRDMVSHQSGRQQPLAVPSGSPAPSQQHQAIASHTWALQTPTTLSACLTFKILFKAHEKKILSPPHTLHYWLVTQLRDSLCPV